MFRHVIFLTASFIAISCSSTEPVEPEVIGVYAGTYSQGIEDSFFSPCVKNENWLIKAEDEAIDSVFAARVLKVLALGANPMFVRLQGVPSLHGNYQGIFMRYDREFAVLGVIEVRPLRANDCR